MTKPLIVTACVCLLSLTICSCALLLTVRSTVAAVPREIAVTRSALFSQVEELRIEALAEIDRQANGIRADATTQLSGIRHDTLSEITALGAATLARVDQIAIKLESAVNKADGHLSSLQAKIEPVIDQISPLLLNSAALVKNANDSWDDSYWDVKALLGSATVATTQTAQTMQTVREATPAFLATAQESNQQAAGIVTDVHKLTTTFTAPLTVKQKIWQAFKSLALLGSHF